MITSRRIIIFDDDEMGYEGADGIYYRYDETRGKNLSLTRQQYIMNRAADLSDSWLMAIGQPMSGGETGFVIPRPATITAITAKSQQVDGDDSEIYIRKNDITPINADNSLLTLQFNQTAANSGETIISGSLNIDMEEGDFLQAIAQQVVGSGVIQYPTITVECAWRDE